MTEALWIGVTLLSTLPLLAVGLVALALAYGHRRSHPRVVLLTACGVCGLMLPNVGNLVLSVYSNEIYTWIEEDLGWTWEWVMAGHQLASSAVSTVCAILLTAAIFTGRRP